MNEPLTPPDCDLRDFPFMPLDVVRLRDSDISSVSTGEEFRCAVLLWCASWHQVPAASLPDNDVVLSQLAGFGRVVSEWQKVREGSLRGWIKCSDGRLYHPVVAEKALEAWDRKLKHHKKKAADRAKIAAKRAADKAAQDEAVESFKKDVAATNAIVEATDSDCRNDKCDCSGDIRLTGTGTGTGTGTNIPTKGGASSFSSSSDSENPPRAACPAEKVGVGWVESPAALSKLLRENGITANPMHPDLRSLVDRGIQRDTVLLACQLARDRKPGERIPPGYVLGILRSWAEESTGEVRAKEAKNAKDKRILDELTGKTRREREKRGTIEVEARVVGRN